MVVLLLAAALVVALLVVAVVVVVAARHDGGDAEAPVIAPGETLGASPAPGLAVRSSPSTSYGADERRTLLELARRAVIAAAKGEPTPELPGGLPAALRTPRGVFVTLELDGELRGCIGHIFPTEPLAAAVLENARHAARDDPRFSPVAPAELSRISIEVSVLTVPEPLAFASPEELLRKLRPRLDGVVLDIGRHRSTFLPQVWDQLPEAVDFLDQLSMKGGSGPDAWRGRGTEVLTYRAEAFSEPAPGRE